MGYEFIIVEKAIATRLSFAEIVQRLAERDRFPSLAEQDRILDLRITED